jgi:tetratricopeptide (TPR) repeat protein
MESVEQAVRLNNEGIRALIEGQQRKSAIALTQSLSILQKLLLQQRTQGAEEGTPSSPSYPSKMTSCNPLVGSFPLLEYGLTFSENIPAFASSSYYIFNQGIAFGSADEIIMLDDKTTLRLYTTGIIFNLALLYHQRGRQSNNLACLQKAESMYSKVRELIVANASISLPNVATILLIASINNLSQMQYEQGRYGMAEEGFKAVACILQNSSLFIGTTPPAILSDFRNQIVLNVLLLKQPNFAAAA